MAGCRITMVSCSHVSLRSVNPVTRLVPRPSPAALLIKYSTFGLLSSKFKYIF